MLYTYKRFLALFFVLIMLLAVSVTFFSCEDLTEGGEDGSTDGSADMSADATDAPVILGDFEITEEVCVVYPSRADDAVIEAAKDIARAIFEKYGIRVKVISDWSYAEGPEILLGKCSYRESSLSFNEGIYAKGYGYSVLSETEIAISARSIEDVCRAAQLFIDEAIGKAAEPKLAAGTVNLKNNEKPAAEYTVNGVNLGDYTIVAEKADCKAALYLAEVIKNELYTELEVAAADDFRGGHAIKIGDFGCNSYGGVRYRVGSEIVDGASTVYIDGDRSGLWEAAAEFFYTEYLATEEESADFTVPETRYSYKWQTPRHTSLGFDELVLQRELAEGVNYYQMKYLNCWDENVDVYAVVVEGSSKAEFRVWAGDLASVDEGKEAMTLQTVGVQANRMEQATGDDVIAAINAGYFMIHTNGYPCGMRIIDGKVLCPPGVPSTFPDSWIGITYDGEFVYGDAAAYEKYYVGKIKQGVATGNHILLQGRADFSSGIHGNPANIKENGYPDLAPYSAIATTADGGFVLVCVDGRPWNGNGKSQGITSVDMLGIMLDLEALYPDIEFVNAFILDGGGSTEMVTEKKTGSSIFVTMNDPCDMSNGVRGISRAVGDIIAVTIPKEN